MKRFFVIYSAVLCLFLSACAQDESGFKFTPINRTPMCRVETNVAIYDDEGTFEVPGCVDYSPAPTLSLDDNAPINTLETSGDYIDAPVNTLETSGEYIDNKSEDTEPEMITKKIRTIKKTKKEVFPLEINPNDYPGEFPTVYNNKYLGDQVVMQNLNTRILAYCRGSEQQIETCVKRLEKSCYVPITDIPQMSGKYDALQTGTYPTRRWRNGESVPRW